MHRSIRKTWLPVAQMFILLCILVWLDEILDLPHLLLGAPPTPINWREALGETALIATVGFLAVSRLIRNVTARARAEEALREAELCYQTVADFAYDWEYWEDPGGALRYVSPACERITGYAADQFIDNPPLFQEIVLPEDRDIWARHHHFATKAPELREVQFRIQRRDGETVWIEHACQPVTDEQGVFLGIRSSNRDITERKRAEDLIRAQRDLGLALSTAVGLEETLQLCLDAAIRASGLDCGGVYLVDEVSGSIDLVFHQGLPVDFVTSASHYDAGSDSTRLIMAGRPVYGKHQELGVPLDEARRHESLRAIAIIPVHHKGRVIACLNVASHTLDEVPAFARNMLETITSQIGSTIARARAEEEIQRRTAQLEALRQVGLELTAQLNLDTLLHFIVSQAIELAGSTAGGLDLYLPERDLLERAVTVGYGVTPLGTVLHRGEGLSGKIWETGEPLIVDDYQHWEGRAAAWEDHPIPITASVGVPVRWGEKFLGVLHVASDSARTFSPADAELLSLFATQAAIAIRNARLYEEAQQELAERKRAEEDLQASKGYINNIIDSSLDMIIACDMKRHIVEFNTAAQETFGYRREEVIGKHVDILYADPQESLAVHETTINKGRCVREILDRRKNGEVFPAFLSASLLHDASGEVVGVMGVARDITARKRAEKALRQRNRELALLNRASQALTSTLDLGQVLATILEAIRHLLDVTASSVWLIDQETDELVCRQATGPQGESVLGWRLAPGQGLAGWVACAGESLIVPDVWADERHFKGVDQQTGLPLRSILTVPLRVKNGIIGVLQVVDTQADRFQPTDLRLAESLATTAAIAIENARLYEQARQDAETKSVLLDEINHRVKNNLAAIIGLLYTELRYADIDNQATYQSVIQNLVNRVQGLTTVHSLLSASGWAPLRIGELVGQTIRSSLQTLPRDKHVSVDMIPSPVHVTPDQAQNLALVINELATNTVKHALQGRDTAHITVRVTTEIESDGVQVEFRDDGPGYPEEVLRLERYNVGLDLVQNVVRKNLRGELSLYNDHGAVAVIQFKAEIPRLATLARNDEARRENSK